MASAVVIAGVLDGMDGRIARALRALAAHPEQARRYGAAAREWVLAHHSLDQTVRQVAQAFAAAAR